MNTNLKPKLQRFASATAFACPICQENLTLLETNFKCCNRHSFDLAKFGYVNLVPQIKQSANYDKENFQNRQQILEAGFYQAILDAVSDLLASSKTTTTILDIGCGEGFYSRKLQESHSEKTFYAFDISKDSVQIAAKSEPNWAVNWFVGDLARLPIKDANMDILLDIFSPANYGEFRRVLSKDGILIKVIPTENHLKEIRQRVQDQLTNKEYSNQDIKEHFQEHFTILSSQTASLTKTITAEQLQALLSMTPLLFHVDQSKIDWSKLTEITIEAEILVGKAF
ncbi:23S_rRNA m1G745 methyltransferase [Streptococcus pneumoniae]|jgi:23S rRNA m(1)G-748 methyltransferase (EC 2.1.1.51)|uniref:rRNA (Guanine-N1-)-methyltransferase n=2 Tax=Streptococcus pneumoniae TaxID=1313 RepID=A0A0H2USD8_STRPN|nr:methyltransferase domain-containing protein [Streptococcus pneumoniae]EHD80986.1 methyltransferase domain protein [Streptococcus pneumoniae GA07643]EJG65911.1 methyltransferase domain protein [Streptococcus pneumoniae 2081074]EJG72181.1 methyltransferase domain protein [Streptococcus pneumoniae 2082170]EJG76807.1 methyltransferase domain protein [Streptococcus pneumoniae SPAR48]ESP63840.1 rRNA (guanine-N1-)-methyltransferase [Streptococcus pneumoniae BHN191]